MFDYTIAACTKTASDVKRLLHATTVIMQLFAVGYPIYALCTERGYPIVNGILCMVSVLYLVFYLITYKCEDKEAAETKRAVRAAYRWIIHSGKLFSLGMTVYGIYFAATKATLASLTLAALMLVFWLLQVLLEVLTSVLEDRFKLFISALHADFEVLEKISHGVGNFVKIVKGEEPEPNAENVPERHRRALEAEIRRNKAEKRERREQKRAERIEKYGSLPWPLYLLNRRKKKAESEESTKEPAIK